MKVLSLLLLVSLAALVESRHGSQELLVRSKRRWVLSTIEIDEEDPGPYPMAISTMYNDKKDTSGQEYHISGMGVDKDPKGVFTIDGDTGVVYAQKSVDREQYSLFKIQFDVLSKETGQSIDRELSFNVEVKDINDNPPLFVSKLDADVDENAKEGEALIQLKVQDIDQSNSPNSTFNVSIISQSPAEPGLGVTHLPGGLVHLTLKGCLDYDKAQKIQVVVGARDHGTPSLSSTAVVTLRIVDKNSHLPTFRERQYQAEVQESIVKGDILRIAVDDKDTPMTPGWRAEYFFIEGNEQRNYKIETDPVTNEGILSVIKGKDFETTRIARLVVGVRNEEPLFVCKSKSPADPPPSPDQVNVTIQVIDVNDPPFYEKTSFDVYQKEEEEPGKVLFTPKVTDLDSDQSKIRHVLLEDPAHWVTIDNKTGKITTTKKMDRESSFVDDAGIYKIVIGAIDNGKPPQTGTCTVLIHLGDINDNEPSLANKTVIMCVNRVNKVIVPARDPDADPYSGPFTFSFGTGDKALMERWKLDPSYGYEGGLVSKRTLPFDNYSVSLVIQDQQNLMGHHTLQVVACDCGNGVICISRKPTSSSLGAAGITFLLLGLFLLLLLLLLVFKCHCNEKKAFHYTAPDEGDQTLIKYNQEGGCASMAAPTLTLAPTNYAVVTDAVKMGNAQKALPMGQNPNMYNNTALTTMNSNGTSQWRRDAFGSHRGLSLYSTWASNSYQGVFSRYNRSLSLTSSHQISDQINMRMGEIQHIEESANQPHVYADEGKESIADSLDKLSLVDPGDDLKFLDDLGPKFKSLAGVCRQTIKERNIQL